MSGMSKKIVILYSGGLDSLIMKAIVDREYPEAEVSMVFFRHGQESEEQELNLLPSDTHVKKIDWLTDANRGVCKASDPFAGAIYIPGRNLVFAVTAACQYLPDEIWLGVLADENNAQASDKNEEFRTLTNAVLKYVLSPFHQGPEVKFPFVERNMTKIDAIKYCLDAGYITRDDISKSSSCWHVQSSIPCGRCKQCLKRALILRNFDIYEEHASLNPLDPESDMAELIAKYESELQPNPDEAVMKRLIAAYRNGDSYWDNLPVEAHVE